MAEWHLYSIDRYERNYKEYEKKHPNELISILRNLDKYFAALKTVKDPKQIRAGYIHPEPLGIVAIDQKGGNRKVKLQQTRLYIYPNIIEKRVYLLAIGSKKTQSKDIINCSEFVKQIRMNKQGK